MVNLKLPRPLGILQFIKVDQRLGSVTNFNVLNKSTTHTQNVHFLRQRAGNRLNNNNFTALWHNPPARFNDWEGDIGKQMNNFSKCILTVNNWLHTVTIFRGYEGNEISHKVSVWLV